MNESVREQVDSYVGAQPGLGKLIARDGVDGILFTGEDEPPGGTFIPFEHLGYNYEIGFFDRREFPREWSI